MLSNSFETSGSHDIFDEEHEDEGRVRSAVVSHFAVSSSSSSSSEMVLSKDSASSPPPAPSNWFRDKI